MLAGLETETRPTSGQPAGLKTEVFPAIGTWVQKPEPGKSLPRNMSPAYPWAGVPQINLSLHDFETIFFPFAATNAGVSVSCWPPIPTIKFS